MQMNLMFNYKRVKPKHLKLFTSQTQTLKIKLETSRTHAYINLSLALFVDDPTLPNHVCAMYRLATKK